MMALETRKTICLLLLFLAAPAFLYAQSTATPTPSNSSAQQESAQPGTVLKVTTRLVLVDVVALDKKGLPITDLKAEDFSMQEEGTGQKVRVFSFQQPTQSDVPLSSEAVKLPPNTVSNVASFRAGKTLSVILLDSLNTDLVKQKYVRQEMLKMLEKLPAGQPVAVYSLGTKLRLLQDFTTDPSLLKQAISNAKGHASPVMENASGGQSSTYLSAPSVSALTELNMTAMLTQVQMFQQETTSFQTDVRGGMTLAALKALAATLSGYPGRKNLIWITSAFPIGIFVIPSGPASSSNATTATAQTAWTRDYAADIERVNNALSNARVAVYPVDASTMVNYEVNSSLSNTDSNGNYLGRTATGQVAGSAIDKHEAMARALDETSEDIMVRRSTMNSVADETGGKAAYNTNDLMKAIRESMEDGETYYTLGYYPENKEWNGKYRKIVVTVTRPGAKLRYRRGYFAVDPKGYQKLTAKQQAIDLGQALSLDVPVSTALTFQAATAPPSDANGNKVMIRFGIDAHPLGFELENDGLEHASVDCAAQAYTLKGEPVQVRASTFAVGLKPEQYQLVMQRFLPCNQSLELNPGDYVLRLGVRDNETGLIGTANARVTVPKVGEATGSKAEDKKP
jgi:VWFA-related protein